MYLSSPHFIKKKINETNIGSVILKEKKKKKKKKNENENEIFLNERNQNSDVGSFFLCFEEKGGKKLNLKKKKFTSYNRRYNTMK